MRDYQIRLLAPCRLVGGNNLLAAVVDPVFATLHVGDEVMYSDLAGSFLHSPPERFPAIVVRRIIDPGERTLTIELRRKDPP